jgi:hypothetical protein
LRGEAGAGCCGSEVDLAETASTDEAIEAVSAAGFGAVCSRWVRLRGPSATRLRPGARVSSGEPGVASGHATEAKPKARRFNHSPDRNV